jgi:hypothetical protein
MKCMRLAISDLPDLLLKRVIILDKFQSKEWSLINYFFIKQHVRFSACAKTISDCPIIDEFHINYKVA